MDRKNVPTAGVTSKKLTRRNEIVRVKNLIEKLKDMDPNAVVCLHHKDGESVLFVLGLRADVVWRETEPDNDMTEEIQARFNAAIEGGEDELDVYAEMLESGIDVDMVRRHLGDEAADHMQTFCEEHGLFESEKPDSYRYTPLVFSTKQAAISAKCKAEARLFTFGHMSVAELHKDNDSMAFCFMDYPYGWDKYPITINVIPYGKGFILNLPMPKKLEK